MLFVVLIVVESRLPVKHLAAPSHFEVVVLGRGVEVSLFRTASLGLHSKDGTVVPSVMKLD